MNQLPNSYQKQILSIDDVDREIEEVKQRIKFQEADLAKSLKALPQEALKSAVNPLVNTIAASAGTGLILKGYNVVKNLVDSFRHKNDDKKEEKKPSSTSIISTSIKSAGIVSLLKLATKLIRNI